MSITVASAATIQDTVDEINAAIANNTVLSGAGLIAQVSGTDIVFETTTNGGGGNFIISVNDDDTNALTERLTAYTRARGAPWTGSATARSGFPLRWRGRWRT